jgi:hypothetical protein
MSNHTNIAKRLTALITKQDKFYHVEDLIADQGDIAIIIEYIPHMLLTKMLYSLIYQPAIHQSLIPISCLWHTNHRLPALHINFDHHLQ